jgi:hypothetical protein
MPKLGLGLSLPQTRAAGGFTPKKISGLSLWLKADAGVTETPETFISQVVISGGGRSVMNGTYTRASGGETSFVKTGDSNFEISWTGVDWYITGDTYYCESDDANTNSYAYNPSFDMSSNWLSALNGCGGTAPTGSLTLSPTGTLLVTGWADQSGNNNNFSGGATFEGNYINGKPAIYFNGTNSYLDSPSTLLDNFSEISLFGVWIIPSGQSNKGVFGTSNYSNLEIVANPDVAVRIRNNDYSQTFISSGFSNLDEWTISYLDAQNSSGVSYKNGQEATETFVSQIVLDGAGTETSDGTYTRSAGGETAFNGPNGNSIDFNGDYWMVYDNTFGDNTYRIAFDFSGTWQIEFGSPDAPTGTNTTITAPIANGSAVQMPLASGVTYSLGRYAYPSFEGLNAEMYLAEFIIYNRRLTTPERQQVEAYLNAKYAIY